MDISAPAPSPARRGNRLKAVALGSGVTVASVIALACVQLLLSPITVRKAGFDQATDGWVVSQYQALVVSFYAWVIAIVFAYWLVTGTLCRGQFLKIRSANITLAISGLTFAFSMALASIQPVEGLFKVVCPVLGLPDTMPPLPAGMYSFDGQTPCEAFANGAAPTVLLGLPFVLLITSAILRIVLSRRR